MTEKDLAETLTQNRCIDGVETAEELVFGEYDLAYSKWSSGESVSVDRVNELELAMVSLRVVKALVENADIDDSELQELATDIRCECAGADEIEETVRMFSEEL